MDTQFSPLRAILGSLLLTIASSGAGPRIALDPQPDEPQPGREAIEAGLKKRRAYVLELEQSLQYQRDKVKLELTDAVAGQQALILTADKDLEKAKRARMEAEFAVKEYVQGIYLQDKVTYMGQIALAKSDLETVRDRMEALIEKKRKGKVDPNEFIRAQLEEQQAKFDLESAETSLQVLEKYTKDKEIKKRQAVVAAAEALEAEKTGLLTTEQGRETRLRELADRLHVRPPEDLVVSLIDDAVSKEGKVVTLLGEAQKIEDQIRETPAQAAGLTEKLVAKKSEVTSLMNQAKTQLLEAVNLGEQVKSLRIKLRDAEIRFRREREILERLEADVAKMR